MPHKYDTIVSILEEINQKMAELNGEKPVPKDQGKTIVVETDSGVHHQHNVVDVRIDSEDRLNIFEASGSQVDGEDTTLVATYNRGCWESWSVKE